MESIPLPLTIGILALLTVLSFVISCSETALIGLSKIRLRHMVQRGMKRAQSIQRLMMKLDKFIAAILVFNNFVNVAISSLVTGMCVIIFGYKWGIIFATFGVALFIVILCEITPKVIAIKNSERIALAVAPAWEFFLKIFSPIIAFFSGASNIIIRLLRIQPAKRSPLITEEELRMMIELGKEEGFVSDDEGRMLQRIFEFGDIRVGDIMVPLNKIVSVDINSSPEGLLDIFVEEGHARLPVYRNGPSNIVGIVYAHDLLYLLRDKGLFLLPDLLHEPYTVLRSMRVHELLKRFQNDKIQIAIVIDEKKNAVGLVTLEDLIEEIVGEIEELPAHGRFHSHRGKRNSV